MTNLNKQGVHLEPNVAPKKTHLILIAHNLNRPIREYVLPNLYYLNPNIGYRAFGNNQIWDEACHASNDLDCRTI